ncbi:MAG: hypothetical protein ACYC6N_02580 [Pirellulaceae bacterium]
MSPKFRAELSNHLHLVLRTLPRVATRWTAEDVVRRWLTITRLAKCFTDDVPAPDPQRVEQLARNKNWSPRRLAVQRDLPQCFPNPRFRI